MANPVIMPRQGQSVESCIITQWHKKPGDEVKSGDLLFSYETDKAAFEEASAFDGVMLAAFFEEGDDVPVLTNVCVIGAPGESFAEFAPGDAPVDTNAPAEAAQVSDEKAEAPAQFAAAPISGDMKISPRARSAAERSGADLSKVSASGPDGRVIARDVQALIDGGQLVTPAAREAYQGGLQGTGMGGRVTLSDLESPAPAAAPAAAVAQPQAETWEEPLSNIRKSIARAMTASLSSMAQLTHNLSYDCTEIQALRKQFKEKGAPLGMDKVTLNDIILYAVARTLVDPKHKALNANLVDNKMIFFRGVNLGVAVDTERGLMVPTLFGADSMSLLEISQNAKKLAADCQAGTINPDYLRGGSFTVSNLGALGIETFTPVINPPQTGILGVNTITTGVREVNGEIKGYPKMSLSLTYDHRALDGAPASRFLKDLAYNLENFTMLLAKG